ncbi:MAG: cupin domain-containing protein [Beutenbergiaceae bacterium]
MEQLPKPPTTKNPPEYFTGDVWADPIAGPREGDQRQVVVLVRFAPGARTAWHHHERGQTLRVTSGVALMQTRGGPVQRVSAGSTVYFAPGEVHWHGASPDDFMEHLAMHENADDPANTTTWLAHVTDEEYSA